MFPAHFNGENLFSGGPTGKSTGGPKGGPTDRQMGGLTDWKTDQYSDNIIRVQATKQKGVQGRCYELNFDLFNRFF